MIPRGVRPVSDCRARGWGGGGTKSLSLDTDLGTTAPHPLFFGHGQPLVLPYPDLQPALLMEAQGQPLQIVTF